MLPTSSTVTLQPSASVSRLNQARTLRVLGGQRLAVDAALGRAADGGGLHQGRPQALRIDAQVARHSAVPRVGERRNLHVLADRGLVCSLREKRGQPRAPLGGDLPDPPPFEAKRRGFGVSPERVRAVARSRSEPARAKFSTMSNTPNAERKTLILTGASRGIGHATVKRFASAGWRVITCSRHAFPENCPWEMGPEDHIQVDLANPEDTRRAIGEMRAAARRRRTPASTRWSTTPASRPRARAGAGSAPSRPRSRTGSTCSRSISSPRSCWRAA